MSGLIKLFTLDVNGDISLDRDEIRLHPPILEIFKRDKGSKGDSEGRLKLQAFKELAFVYYMADIDSDKVKLGLTDKEAVEKGITFAKLDSSFKPDKVIFDAINYYKEFQNADPVNLIYQQLKIGLNNNSKIYQEVNNTIEAKLKELREVRDSLNSGNQIINPAKYKEDSENGDTEATDKIDQYTVITNNIDTLLKYSKNIYSIIKDYPEALENLKILESKIFATRKTRKVARGGNPIGKRAEPKRNN